MKYSSAKSVTFFLGMNKNVYRQFTLQKKAWLNSLIETDELMGYIEFHFTVSNRMCKEFEISSWHRGPLSLTDISPTNTTLFPSDDPGSGFEVTETLVQYTPFRYFPIFNIVNTQANYWIKRLYLWFKEFNRYFRKTEYFAFRKINEQSFSNRIPWFESHFMLIYTFLIINVS